MNSGLVTILGSGTSNGVPILGKVYDPEYLAQPKNHRFRPSILIEGPEGNVLVDTTPDMRSQLLRENVLDLAAVIITHTHADHIMGLDDVRAFSLKSGEKIPVYTSREYQADIRRIFPYAFGEATPGTYVPRMELIDVPDVLELVGLKIQTMWVEHGHLPCLALRINNFAYVTDVKVIPPAAWKLLQGLDVLVLDAVRRLPHPNHLHFEAAIEVAQSLGARQTFFTHLSDDYDHEKTESQLPQGIRLAFDGLKIPL